MRRRIVTSVALAIALCVPAMVFAQSDRWSIGAAADYVMPIGGLGDRFVPTVGGSIRIGLPTGTRAEWAAVFEYAKFDETNSDKLFLRKTLDVAGGERAFDFPLEGLEMMLELVGGSADVRFHVVDAGFMKADIGLGFGMFRWRAVRGAFQDSLYADTSGSGTRELIAVVKVPPLTQQDWSGGFSAGLDMDIPLVDPVTVWLGARFKLIAGELWPSLDLDLENVSTFQIIDVKLGVRIDL